ncbi:MAG: RluA family pseudouridine synthase [Bacteroidales bacterium]|nr:RluA family pseudouridine synthase [Bacteroidales bacterium]
MKTIEKTVEQEMTLMELIGQLFPDSSRTSQKEILAHRVVIQSRRVTQYDYPLKPGMKVTIEGDENRGKPARGKMPIVFEDRYLMVVNKPSGLLSNSTEERDITVISEINEYLIKRRSRQRAHIVHRLDRDTSGLLLVAKSKEVARALERDWKGQVTERIYVGVTWGTPVPRQGTIVSWLKDGEYSVVSSPTDNGGKKAITHYKTLKNNRKYALVQFSLETGRRNQIRVHMRENGHPILKDPMYGYDDDRSPMKRLALHAMRLCFIHPVTGKEMRFDTGIPEEFDLVVS